MPIHALAKLIVTFFITTLLSPIVSSKTKLRIVTEEFAPYNYLHENEVVGKNTQLVKLVLNELSLTTEIEILPWVRAYNTALHHPNTLIFSLAKNSQREQSFHWIGVLSTVDVCLFSLKSKDLTEISNLEQMKRYRVVSQREGHISQQLVKEGFEERKNLFNAISIEHAIQMLLLNRADFIGYPAEVLFYNIERMGEDHKQLLRTNFCIDSTALYLAFNKQTSTELVNEFRAALEKAKKDINWQPGIIHKANKTYLDN